MRYEICVEGHVDERWRETFEGFEIKHAFTTDHHPITMMVGQLADQAALYGTLSRLRDLGVRLLSLTSSSESISL